MEKPNDLKYSVTSTGIKLIPLLIFVILLVLGLINKQPSSSPKKTLNKSPITRIMTITKEKSDTVIITDGGPQVKFLVGAIDDDVPFVCHYNGGKEHSDQGGWDEEIPPRRDWKRLNWKAKFTENVGVAVCFNLSTETSLKKAQLSYTITPL